MNGDLDINPISKFHLATRVFDKSGVTPFSDKSISRSLIYLFLSELIFVIAKTIINNIRKEIMQNCNLFLPFKSNAGIAIIMITGIARKTAREESCINPGKRIPRKIIYVHLFNPLPCKKK